MVGRHGYRCFPSLTGNKIKELPSTVCDLKSLRMLDIRDNRILMLPRELCRVRTLETLNLDALEMSYPAIGKMFVFINLPLCSYQTTILQTRKCHFQMMVFICQSF